MVSATLIIKNVNTIGSSVDMLALNSKNPYEDFSKMLKKTSQFEKLFFIYIKLELHFHQPVSHGNLTIDY